jgi:hypothetical protein
VFDGVQIIFIKADSTKNAKMFVVPVHWLDVCFSEQIKSIPLKFINRLVIITEPDFICLGYELELRIYITRYANGQTSVTFSVF